jgi:hypothetical protein
MSRLDIEDIRVANYWGWYKSVWDGFTVPKPEPFWTILRHEIQVRDAVGNWSPIPVVDINKDGKDAN